MDQKAVNFMPLKLSPQEQKAFDLMKEGYRQCLLWEHEQLARATFAVPFHLLMMVRTTPLSAPCFDSMEEAKQFLEECRKNAPSLPAR